jgi:hypothetical protein
MQRILILWSFLFAAGIIVACGAFAPPYRQLWRYRRQGANRRRLIQRIHEFQASHEQNMRLYESTNCRAWRETRAQYDALILAHDVNQLPELDAWYCNELPRVLAARQPASVTKAEFLDILRWKMKRGDWREWNRVRVANTDARVIQKHAQDAFAAARALDADIPTASKEYKKPLQILSELDGVGPATASAVLAAYRPDLYPFFDEWIAREIPGLGKVAFTASYYWKYADALRGKAKELRELCGAEWNAQEVGQALWVASGGR